MTLEERSEVIADRGIPIRVLGPVEVKANGGSTSLGGPKQRALFAMLVARVGRVVTTDELVDGIWGEEPPAAVLASIHTYVSNLRTSFDYAIERHGSGYLLDADRALVDGYVFEDEVDAGRKDVVANPMSASEGLRQALALWRGRAYADVAIFPGLSNEAIRLEELRLAAVETRIDADLSLGRHSSVVGELEALAAEYPLRESLRAKHMLALYRNGRQGEALRAFQQTRDYLREELGIDPSEELQDLEERILNHDYTLIQSKEVVTEPVALLFTDIVQSTAMWETHPGEMQSALAQHDDIVQSSIEGAGGAVVKALGDEFIAIFSEAGLAARAATEAQRHVAERDWTPLDLTIRMAIDAGEVERRGGDLFGPPMNRGSRLLASAHGQQILLSGDAQQQLSREPGIQIKSLGEHHFKGLGSPQAVYQLVVDGLPVGFPPLRTSSAGDFDRTFGDAIRGYELRERVGLGSFATVYRGYQPSIGREVAIKVIRPEFANHPAFVRRFESEARLVASLEHPHIVSVYDYWRDADGAYVVGPYLAGRSLADEDVGTLPVDRVLGIATQVGSALSYAHRHGVVHRDIKPANILLDSDGNAYLADFGIAARAVEAATGVVSASAGYRAPEEGDEVSVDTRSDIYSLAAVIARLLTGDQPDTFDLDTLHPTLRRALERGLASDPADRPESVDEFLQLLTSTPGPGRATTTFRNPYKGLAAFQEPDAPDFFGRDDEIRRAVEMVSTHRLSAVIGPSGSGKSSLVLAGLLPALRAGASSGSESWINVDAVPGGHPFEELATAISAVATEHRSDLADELAAGDGKGLLRIAKRTASELGGDLVVVIDQFEELFTLVASNETRDRFVGSLVTAAQDPLSPVRVVLTLRADFFHEALSLPELGTIISAAHLALAPLDADGARKAILEPAARAGLEFEPGLADRIVADLADQAGSLPLLQFTLDRLASSADGGLLTNDQYDAFGGVRGALAERADAAYQSLTDAQKEVAQHVFTRLLTVSDEADDLRRRVRVTEFRSLGLNAVDVDAVLNTFGKERLLTFDVDPTTRGATVEVAHEALLREWSTLRRWVETRRESLVLQRRFQTAFTEWEESEGNPDGLLTGGKLSQYEDWASGDDVILSGREQTFLDTSVEKRTAELNQRRTRRHRIMGGFAAAAAVAVILAVAAFVQQRAAERGEALAQARQLILEADTAVASDPELSMLLALEAIDDFRAAGTEPPPSAIGALRVAVTSSVVDRRIPGGDFVAVSPDGGYLATLGQDDTVAVWNVANMELVSELDRGEGRPFAAVFDASADRLVVLYDEVADGMRVWEWRTGSFRDTGGETPDIETPELTIDQERGLVAYWSHDSIQVVALDDPGLHYTLSSSQPDGQTWNPEFTSDGRVLFFDWRDRTGTDWVFRVADAHTGEDLDPFAIERDEVGFDPGFISLAPDETRVAISDQESVALVDLATSAVLWVNSDLTRVMDPVWLDDQTIFVGGESAPSIIDANTGEVVRPVLGGPRGGTYSYAALPGTKVAAAGLFAPETVIYDLSQGRSDLPAITSGFAGVADMAFVGDGGLLAVSDMESNALIDSDSGVEQVHRSGAVTDLPFVWGFPYFSSDGLLTVGPDENGRSILWSNSDSPVRYTAPPGWWIQGVSDDGLLAVIVGPNEEGQLTARLIRTSDQSVVGDLYQSQKIQAVRFVFSPDGSMVLTDNYKNLELWDTSTGALLRELESDVIDPLSFHPSFTPDGTKLVLGSMAGTIFVIDVAELLAGVPTEEAVVGQISAHNTFVQRVHVSPDGSMILSRAHDEQVKLWDLETMEKLGEFDNRDVDQPFRFFAFHPTERQIYVSLPGDQIGIFTLDTDELMDIARSRLTRELTQEECRVYLDLDNCPASQS